MDLGLKGKIVVISGAAGIKGSIGETILQRLADQGAIPAVIDRNKRGFEYVADLQERGIDFNKLGPQINKIFSSDASIFEKIKNFSNDYTAFMIKQPYLPNFIIQELNRNPDFVKELVSPKSFPGIKKFQNQINAAVHNGEIRPIASEQLFINILALNVFPFIGAPLIKGFINSTDKNYKTILEHRKTDVSDFIIQSIKLK